MIATAPPRPPATPACRARRRSNPSTARTKTPETARHSAWSHASTYRRQWGRLNTHWRTGTTGKTSSTRHEGACRLLADGVDIRVVQLILGHRESRLAIRISGHIQLAA